MCALVKSLPVRYGTIKNSQDASKNLKHTLTHTSQFRSHPDLVLHRVASWFKHVLHASATMNHDDWLHGKFVISLTWPLPLVRDVSSCKIVSHLPFQNTMPTTWSRAAAKAKASSRGAEKEEESDDLSLSSIASSVSNTTASSKRPRLAFHIQKQLAIDIEGHGGLFSFVKASDKSFSSLLDKNLDLYGKRGDSSRTILRRKLCYWRTLEKTT